MAVPCSHFALPQVIAGHDHAGGYAEDKAGLHHLTLCSPLVCAPEEDAAATLEVRSA